jgi:hypothetical protein
MANKFSANAPTLGYLYQIRYALFVLLQRIANDPDAQISIEFLDDVAFEHNGTPLELLQLKHHINKEASLTNSSADLWKTIRIWSENLDKDSNVSQEIALILVTTATAPNGSIASKLRHGSSRDEGEALGKMLKVIEDSNSVSNQPCYNAFKSLSKKQQQFLISKIQIVDQSPNIADLEEKIVKRLRLSTRFPQPLKSRLEGWWFERVINHLMDENHEAIGGIELQNKIDSISDDLRPDNLPNDFPTLVEKDETSLSSNERIFVEQLRLILLGDTRLRFAIGDYYRAFSQRTKWLAEGLVLPDELEKYETMLIGEWRRYFEIMKEEMVSSLPDENRMIELGKSIFKWAETNNHLPIRRDFSGDFARGSYHILSNDLKVGWHPEFQTRLGHLITQAVSQLV